MFKIGSPVKGDAFIDRIKHLPIFKAYLDINQHVMIKAPRRYGKTSMIKHVFEDNDDYKFIYIDVRRASSLESLANQILDKAYSFVGIENFVRESTKSILGMITSINSLKIPNIAEVSLKHFEAVSKNNIEYLTDSLDVVDAIANKKNINIKFIFDEFQDIVNIDDKEKKLLDKLRSVIQHHDNVTYIFLGSIESIMTKIFTSQSSSFHKFAKIMNLEGLDTKEVFTYTERVFDKKGFSYNKHLLKKLIDFLQGHPDYTARALQNIYIGGLLNNNRIEDISFIQSVGETLLENKAYLEELISKAKMKKNQYELLVSIALNTKTDLSSATLYNTNIALEELGLIKNVARGSYVINDIFLNILLQQNNDEKLALEDIVSVEFT